MFILSFPKVYVLWIYLLRYWKNIVAKLSMYNNIPYAVDGNTLLTSDVRGH